MDEEKDTERRKRLHRIARSLPLVTVLAWLVSVFVPVLDSGESSGPTLTYTTLGETPLSPDYLEPGFITIWVIVLVLAVLPWLIGPSRWWSAAAILFSIVLLGGLVILVIDPPMMMWDGQTGDGMPTGGMEVALPAAGYVICAVGSAALGAAGVCGWMGASRRGGRG